MPRVSDLTSATALDADDEIYVVEDGNSRRAALSQFALGWGQTWQRPTRVDSTSYQNLTGRPIQVSIHARSSGVTRVIQVSEDGITWITVGTTSNSTATEVGGVSIVIPVNWYYRIDGATNALEWAELR